MLLMYFVFGIRKLRSCSSKNIIHDEEIFIYFFSGRIIEIQNIVNIFAVNQFNYIYNSDELRLISGNSQKIHCNCRLPNRSKSCIIAFGQGALAQLGARLDGIEEVTGSNPVCSTQNREPHDSVVPGFLISLYCFPKYCFPNHFTLLTSASILSAFRPKS